MILVCDYIEAIKPTTMYGRNLIVELSGVNFYHLYMNNDMDNILKEIPTEEIEKYLQEQREIDENKG